MTDDSDDLDRASTAPLPAVGGPDDQHQTQPLLPADASRRVPDPPTMPHQSALRLPDEYTEMIPADIAMPDDDTGAIASSSVFEDVPTQELLDDQTLVPASSPIVDDDDATNPGAVSDDAIVRRVVLPQDLSTSPLPPTPKTQPTVLPDRDETQFAVVPAQPRNPLPNEQLPPARGPVPLPRFQVRANDNATRAADVQPSATGDKTMQIWGAGLGLALVWGLVANLIAASLWLDPTRLIVLMLSAIVPIGALVVGLGRPRHRAPDRRDFVTLGRPIGAAAVLLLIAALPWQVGFVRGSMRGLAGDSPEAMRRVLSDRSAGVALAECVRLAPNFAKPGIVDALADTLAERPEVVRQCLARTPDIASLLSGTLARTWYEVLVAADTPTDRACTIADSVAQLDRPPGEVETRLLGCIMFAPAEAQRCCAAALAELGDDALAWVSRVQGQRGYVPDADTANGLLALTFGAANITAEQARFVQDADFRGAEPRRMAVVLGCAAIGENAPIGPQFLASVPDSCPLDRGSYPTDTDTWGAICEASMDRLVRRRRDPGETLCLAAQSVAIERAVAEAANLVQSARKRAR